MPDAMANDAEAFRAERVRKHCRTPDDLKRLASYLAFQAAAIYQMLGGPTMVAERFTAAAERAKEQP